MSIEEQILSGGPIYERFERIFMDTRRFLVTVRLSHSLPVERPEIDRLWVEHITMSYNRTEEYFRSATIALIDRNIAAAAVLTRAIFEEFVTTAFLTKNREYVEAFVKATVQHQYDLARSEAQYPRSTNPDYQQKATIKAENLKQIIETHFARQQLEIPTISKQIEDITAGQPAGEHKRIYRLYYKELSQYVHPTWGEEPDPIRIAGYAVVAMASLIITISQGRDSHGPIGAALASDLSDKVDAILYELTFNRQRDATPTSSKYPDDLGPCPLGHPADAVAASLGFAPARCPDCGDTAKIFGGFAMSPDFPSAPEMPHLPRATTHEWVSDNSDTEKGLGYIKIDRTENQSLPEYAVYVDEWGLEEERNASIPMHGDERIPFEGVPAENRWTLFEYEFAQPEMTSVEEHLPAYREAWSEELFGLPIRPEHIATNPDLPQPLEVLIHENPQLYGQTLWAMANRASGYAAYAEDITLRDGQDESFTLQGPCPQHGWHECRYYLTEATIQNIAKFVGVENCGEVSKVVSTWA